MKNRYLIQSLPHQHLAEDDKVRKLKVSCHALLLPDSHTASAGMGSAHALFLFLQLLKQLCLPPFVSHCQEIKTI